MADLQLSGFKLTFDDEFNKLSLRNGTTGTWDTNYWWGKANGVSLDGNGEKEWYIDASYAPTSSVKPWTVGGGVLQLSADKASAAIKPYLDGHDYTSGMVTSYHSFTQTYGYFEMRAELPAGKGLWPAFWLLPADGSWPPELDVMEVLGQDPTNVFNTVHSKVSGVNSVGTDHFSTNFDEHVADLSKGYHTFGVDWEADRITWYVDDQKVAETATPPDMHKPMYMLANLAVGGYWPGSPDATTAFPAHMNVDYIRAYSKAPAAVAVAQDKVSAPDGHDPGLHGAKTSTPAPTSPPAAQGSHPTTTVLGSGPDTLVLKISEDAYKGDAMYTIKIDGKAVASRTLTAHSWHSEGKSDTVVVHGDWSPGNHTASVTFENDRYGGTAKTDRNLYVDSATYDGHAVSGSSHALLSHSTHNFVFHDDGLFV